MDVRLALGTEHRVVVRRSKSAVTPPVLASTTQLHSIPALSEALFVLPRTE
jgi:hypothetical protein